MRNLTRHGAKGTPKGLAFELADLALIGRWADAHDCRMAVRLDHGADGEEYEEVIAIHMGMSSRCQLIMWRSAAAVFVQPLIGRLQRYRSVAQALRNLDLKPRIVLTDITATSWFY
jgi:hypothetical protein